MVSVEPSSAQENSSLMPFCSCRRTSRRWTSWQWRLVFPIHLSFSSRTVLIPRRLQEEASATCSAVAAVEEEVQEVITEEEDTMAAEEGITADREAEDLVAREDGRAPRGRELW